MSLGSKPSLAVFLAVLMRLVLPDVARADVADPGFVGFGVAMLLIAGLVVVLALAAVVVIVVFLRKKPGDKPRDGRPVPPGGRR